MALETISPNQAAVGRSISFRPASLYDDAVEYGEKNGLKTNGSALNPSEVVCLALRRLFEAEGFQSAGVVAADEEARFWDKAKAAAKKNPKFKQRISDMVQQSERERLAR